MLVRERPGQVGGLSRPPNSYRDACRGIFAMQIRRPGAEAAVGGVTCGFSGVEGTSQPPPAPRIRLIANATWEGHIQRLGWLSRASSHPGGCSSFRWRALMRCARASLEDPVSFSALADLPVLVGSCAWPTAESAATLETVQRRVSPLAAGAAAFDRGSRWGPKAGGLSTPLWLALVPRVRLAAGPQSWQQRYPGRAPSVLRWLRWAGRMPHWPPVGDASSGWSRGRGAVAVPRCDRRLFGDPLTCAPADRPVWLVISGGTDPPF